MFERRLRALGTTSLAVALVATTACSERKASDLSFRVTFACEADREISEQLRLRVLQGGCDGTQAAYEATLSKGEGAPSGKTVGPGTYGFEATALREGVTVAARCVEARLPSSTPPEIELVSADCHVISTEDASTGENPDPGAPALDGGDAAPEDAAPEDAALEDAESRDAAGDAESRDAAGEAGAADADSGDSGDSGDDSGSDAAPPTCNSDCADPYPCTEDRCVNGACVHDPYTGPRECDGVACTEGDQCNGGTCIAGTPNDQACPDDGDPCTAETCDPQSGCNRTNASGVQCDDKIDCTDNDTCSDGVCRGSDTCSMGTCSAASGMCTSCLNAGDCDDGNPCTTDTCSGGACNYAFNTDTCSDGKSCTSNDVCSGGKCSGTSTCPSDATCGGSSCKCNDSTDTLCNNTCVSLASDADNCGQCGRTCPNSGTCEHKACKPMGANCDAWVYGGHEYLVCSDLKSWTEARSTCLGWGYGLAIINSQGENDFLHGKSSDSDRWIGANDRGSNGQDSFNNQNTQCRKNQDEGSWFWASPTDGSVDHDGALCTMKQASDNSWSCVAATVNNATVYENWGTNEPNNSGCSCPFLKNCSEGEDCALLQPGGTWNDSTCGNTAGFICETP